MKKGIRLSYVNIFIIVMVIGGAAKFAGPRLSAASTETRVSRLIDALEEIRANIDLYRVHHNGGALPCSSGADFEAAVTTPSGTYRPYIRKIPANPFNDLNTVRLDGETAGAGIAGWRFDSQSGVFQADNDKTYAAL